MEKSISLTYKITNPNKDESSNILKTVKDELKFIKEVVGDQISDVVIKCFHSTKNPSLIDGGDAFLSIQNDLQINHVTVVNRCCNGVDCEANSAVDIINELKQLVGRLDEQIEAIEDEHEEVADELRDISNDLEIRLNTLEDMI